MLGIVIYAETTGWYTEEEIEKMDTNLLTIEVPEDLLFQWYQEEFGGDKDSFFEWYYLDSTADFTVGLYDWLSAHGYKIEREN